MQKKTEQSSGITGTNFNYNSIWILQGFGNNRKINE
jgi:hypothetical protein